MDNFVFKLNWNIKVSIVSKFDRYINGFSEISKFRRFEWKCLMYFCKVHWTFVMLRCYAHDDCQLNQSYRSIDSISCCRFDCCHFPVCFFWIVQTKQQKPVFNQKKAIFQVHFRYFKLAILIDWYTYVNEFFITFKIDRSILI